MNKNVVFMIAIADNEKYMDAHQRQRSRDTGYEWSIKSWGEWCKKNDVELFIMDTPICSIDEMKLTWQRYFVFDILEKNNISYNQICMVDADTIVHPDTPNFFEMTDNKYCGVINPVNEWILKSIEIYSKFMFNEKIIPFWDYINGGFQIFNETHKDFLNLMKNYYLNNKDELIKIQNTYGAGSDQTPLNYLLKEHNIDVKLLSQKFNMQDLVRYEALSEDLIHTKMGWIYHFNTWPKPNPRYWLEKTYRSLHEN